MCRDASIIVILILLNLAKYSVAAKYEYILENESIFTECHNKPSGYSGISAVFDFSNATLTLVEDGLQMSGFFTTLLDIEPTDRIQLTASVTYFDRGIWQPTILNIKYADFCKIWLDEKNYFYQFTSHIQNMEEAKKNCFHVKGIKLFFDSFVMTLTYGLDVPLRPGRYRTTYLLTVFDQLGDSRSSFCFEVNGSFEKLKTK